MEASDLLALLTLYVGVPCAWLSSHPIVLCALWLPVSAGITWLGRRRTDAERAELARARPYIFAVLVMVEGLGVDLPKVAAAVDFVARHLLRLAVDKLKPPT